MPSRRRHGRGAALLGLIAVVSGCSHDTRSADGSGAAPAPEVGAAGPGALDPYLERIYGSGTAETSTTGPTLLAVEELVASCMAEQGFDYIPDVPGEAGDATPWQDDIDLSDPTVARELGYGISTMPERAAAMLGLGTPSAPDPNQEYRDSMSEAEIRAYEAALFGSETSGTDPASAGCYGFADSQVNGSPGPAGTFADIESELGRFWESVADDGRMVALNERWSACMADKGHVGVTDPARSSGQFLDAYYALVDDAGRIVDAGELRDLARREIQRAVADLECQEHVSYSTESTAITHALQAEFVAVHEQALDEWAEAVDSRQGG